MTSEKIKDIRETISYNINMELRLYPGPHTLNGKRDETANILRYITIRYKLDPSVFLHAISILDLTLKDLPGCTQHQIYAIAELSMRTAMEFGDLDSQCEMVVGEFLKFSKAKYTKKALNTVDEEMKRLVTKDDQFRCKISAVRWLHFFLKYRFIHGLRDRHSMTPKFVSQIMYLKCYGSIAWMQPSLLAYAVVLNEPDRVKPLNEDCVVKFSQLLDVKKQTLDFALSEIAEILSLGDVLDDFDT